MNYGFEDVTRLNERLKNGIPVETVRLEDSTIGKQLEELKRIADAAQKQAELAVEEARLAKEREIVANKKAKVSRFVSVLSAISTFLMWLFTRDDLISLVSKVLSLLEQG